MLSIPCKQFVFGKILGAARGSYRIVASSENITLEFGTEIRQLFNGCRPQSVEVRNFSTTLVASPYMNSYIVLLRMERFYDKDLGYFIQEHYVIIDRDHLAQKETIGRIVKPWFWLLNLPAIQLYSSIGELPNAISLNLKASFWAQIEKSTSLLSIGNSAFEDTLKNTIGLLLNVPPVAIQVKEDDHLEKQFWCIALSLLLPAKETSNLRIFIGSNLPDDWTFELGIVTQRSVDRKVKFVNPLDTRPIDQDIRFPYFSGLVQRCLALSRSETYISQLLGVIDKVEVDWQHPIIQEYRNSLDTVIGVFAMPTIGLSLVRNEIHKGIINPADLQWIWRNMSLSSGEAGEAFDVLTTNDLLTFLPILIRENLDNWNRRDFIAFRDVVSNRLPKPEKFFVDFRGNDDALLKFLTRWLEIKGFSTEEHRLYFHLVRKVASENFSAAMGLFFKWVRCYQDSGINPFYFLFEIVKAQREPISADNLIHLFFVCAYQVKSIDDLNSFEKITQKLSVARDATKYYENIYTFLTKVRMHDFSTSEQLDPLRFLLSVGQDVGFSISDIVFALFHIMVVAQNLEMFETLAIILHSEYRQPLFLPPVNGLENEWYEIARKWFFVAGSEKIFAAYAYILIRLNATQIIRGILTELLCQSPISFTNVANQLLHNYHVKRGHLVINLVTIQNLELQRRLQLLSEFLLSTCSKSSPPTDEEAEIFYKTILALDRVELVETEKLLMIFEQAGVSGVCQGLVEHQIRNALTQTLPDFEKAKEWLHRYKEVVQRKNLKWYPKSKFYLDVNISLSYFRGLSQKEFKIFLHWFLESPLGADPPIDSKSYPATSGLVKMNGHWLKTNPFVRLRLFEGTINKLQQ